jgi:hypothetical protein
MSGKILVFPNGPLVPAFRPKVGAAQGRFAPPPKLPIAQLVFYNKNSLVRPASNSLGYYCQCGNFARPP